mmetsp:Transcript_5212/g.5669  ORF Transcript_5212/g.5669 Transcript_5212/m.5669 type:complete len:229 (+) Transcript_5212:1-687(+)
MNLNHYLQMEPLNNTTESDVDEKGTPERELVELLEECSILTSDESKEPTISSVECMSDNSNKISYTGQTFDTVSAYCAKASINVYFRYPKTTGDVRAVEAISNEAHDEFTDYWIYEVFIGQMNRGGAILATVEDGTIIGYIIYSTRLKNKVYLSNVAVHKDYRGKGVGSLMTNTLLDIVRKTGFEYVSLDVNSKNARAIKMYKGVGFTFRPGPPGPYGVVMECKIIDK